ncbi:MAG: hypothetical protein VB099_15370 [Candidatus Limiplasma sp.]|nr:hypothetical protein [Candidatus Limiplasma sp.]
MGSIEHTFDWFLECIAYSIRFRKGELQMKKRNRLIAFFLILILMVGLAAPAFAAEVCSVCGSRISTTYGNWEHRQKITEIRNGNEVWANYEQIRTVHEKCPKNANHHNWHGSQTRWLGWRFEYYTG